MVFFPNCKINLGLRVLHRRNDGYHELETVFYPLPVKDVLEIIPAASLNFTASGLPIPGDAGTNLCYAAYHLLREDFPELPPVHIYLHKHIPIGAGLGGGSADGAGMLQILNRCFQLGLSQERLMGYAARLGSDCPFFILNTAALGGGRGEDLIPIAVDLSRYSFALVHPGIHVSTAWAFSQYVPVPGDRGKKVQDVILQPIGSWAEDLVNDLEMPVFAQYPELRVIKERLYDAGALYASMSGSGSCLFGIFEKEFKLSPTFTRDYPVILLT